MKKFFKYAAMIATALGMIAFASCSKDDDKDDDDLEEIDKLIENLDEQGGETDEAVLSDSVAVVVDGKYAVKNASIEGGTLNFTVTAVDGKKGAKVVTFTVNLKDDEADGQSFTLGDDNDHTSYFGRKDGKLCSMKQADAVANASNVIMALSSWNESYMITSATVNKKVSEAGATLSTFVTYKK